MIVVADTSPINYLVLIQHVEILPRLYQRVLIPTAVEQELLHIKTPQAVRTWMDNHPDWLEVRPVISLPDPSMADLDSGEAEAIYLAEEVRAHQIIVDEMFGRRVANPAVYRSSAPWAFFAKQVSETSSTFATRSTA